MTYNLDIINLFINKFINNNDFNIISKNLSISIPTLKRWSLLYKFNIISKIPLTYNDLKNNKKIHALNKKDKYKETILNYVETHEGCILNDIYLNINKELSKPSICRVLKNNNVSRKKCNIRVVCKDINKIEEERKIFSKNLEFNNFLESEFIDESSFCIDDIINYGYSKKGKEILKITKHSRNKERLTLLSSISKDSIKYKIINGSVNSDIYIDFINDIKSYVKDRNIVQDNARIHHSKKVKEFAKNNNINMVYNPAYSPEFNPIELIFHKLKIEYRKLKHTNLRYDIIECLNKINNNDLNNAIKHSFKFIEKYK